MRGLLRLVLTVWAIQVFVTGTGIRNAVRDAQPAAAEPAPVVAVDSVVVDAGWTQPTGTYDSLVVFVNGWQVAGLQKPLRQVFRVKPFPVKARFASAIDPTLQTDGPAASCCSLPLVRWKDYGNATFLFRLCLGTWAKVNGATVYTEKGCSNTVPFTVLSPKPADRTLGGSWLSPWRKG